MKKIIPIIGFLILLQSSIVLAQSNQRTFAPSESEKKRVINDPGEERLRLLRAAVDAEKLRQQKLKDKKQSLAAPVNQEGLNWNGGNQQPKVQPLTSTSNPIQIVSKTPFGENTFNFQVKNVSSRRVTFTVWKAADYEASRGGSEITLDPNQVETGNASFKWLRKNEAFVYKINK